MRFVLAVKQVPASDDAKVDENGSPVRSGRTSVLNPYDEYALRAIVGLKVPGDRISVVTMGPKHASAALRRCLELGADDAFLITGPDFAGSDTWATSRVLAAFTERYACDADLIVFGRQATDGDTGQVPYETAALLDRQQFAYVASLERSRDGFIAVQDYGDSVRRSEVPAGSVVSFGRVDPCGIIPTISQWIAASSKEIVELGRVELGLGLYSVGTKGSKTRIVSSGTVSLARRNRKVEINDPAYAAKFITDQAGVSR